MCLRMAGGDWKGSPSRNSSLPASTSGRCSNSSKVSRLVVVPMHSYHTRSCYILRLKHYPVFLDLKDRPVLVVGAGKVALRKTRGLLEASARYGDRPGLGIGL